MLDSLLRRLRGSHNSIRFRFVRLPLLWLSYVLWFRLRGRSWIEFYSSRLDGFVDVEKPLPAQYAARGEEYFAYIKAHGLEPHHVFLDYGCGFLRTALPLIRYLEKGHYFGVDISEQRIARGRRFLRSNGIAESDYTVHVVSDCLLREVADKRFDFVWAMSVINHMPEEDIRTMLRALRPLMAPGGRFLFVFNHADEAYRWRMKDWWYPESQVRAWAEEAGFAFETLPDYREPEEYVRMAQLSVPARDAGAESRAAAG